jgi:CRP-like cAMP-binding protein
MLPQSSTAAPGLALVRRGIVVRQRVDASGGATAIDAVGPGGLLPLRDSAYAATDVLFCACAERDLAEALGTSLATAREVIRLLEHALERVERIADARGRKSAAGRVAALLGALVDMLSPYRRYDLVPAGLRQRDMAALLAIRHESVCRELRTLESSGAVARVAEGIRIVDRAKLDAVG